MQENKDRVEGSAGCGAGGDCGFSDDENKIEEAKVGLELGTGEIGRAKIKVCGGHNGFGSLEMVLRREGEQQCQRWLQMDIMIL